MQNPHNQRIYMRYEHKVGIDIDLEDSSIHKHPDSDSPDSIHIIKISNQEFPQSAKNFENPYFLKRNEYECMARKRRLSF